MIDVKSNNDLCPIEKQFFSFYYKVEFQFLKNFNRILIFSFVIF